ncbi:RING finger protein [Oopsacas minuta]|uniref:RING finger protein n=1 Tax=Oopsacas minuta TaxID=111878 RepID=A0AAV7JJ57_9METZ|nr:RING finger protein [Oopsacas minuta]
MEVEDLSVADVEHRKSAIQFHEDYIKEHEGHEEMHFTMVLIFLLSIFCGQFILVCWRARHSRSYQATTLLFIWLIPLYYCIKLLLWRMFICWSIFSIISIYILSRAYTKPLQPTTPRLVYRWFLLVHHATLTLGVLGYAIILMLFLVAPTLNKNYLDVITETGVLLIFYGLYYGLLGRDLAEYCVDNMSATFKFSKECSESEDNVIDDLQCYVCNQSLIPSPHLSNTFAETILRLSCGHKFHDFCIRGWCIVGKKHVCPFCRERVNLIELLQQPWQKPNILFGQLLDVLRYFIAWFPVVLLVSQLSYHLLGLS